MNVDQAEAALFELLGVLDAEDWERFVELLDDDVELADELTASWLRGRKQVTAFLRAQAGVVTEIETTPTSVHSRSLANDFLLVTFNARQRYCLDGEEHRELLTGCTVFRWSEGRPRVVLFHFGAADGTRGARDSVERRELSPEIEAEPRTERSLGDEIRRRREAAKLSLRALAERTRLSASFLSQVERSLANPSVSSLRRIAQGLATTTVELLANTTLDTIGLSDGARSGIVVGRSDERARADMRDIGTVVETFSGLREGTLEAWIAEVAPTAAQPAQELSHGGHEFVFVLDGELELSSDGSVVVLRAGDGAHVDGRSRHRLRPIGDLQVRFLSVQTTETR